MTRPITGRRVVLVLAAAALLQAARASAEEAQPQAEAPAPSRFQLDYGWDDARLPPPATSIPRSRCRRSRGRRTERSQTLLLARCELDRESFVRRTVTAVQRRIGLAAARFGPRHVATRRPARRPERATHSSRTRGRLLALRLGPRSLPGAAGELTRGLPRRHRRHLRQSLGISRIAQMRLELQF
jgi:hypothetical protein